MRTPHLQALLLSAALASLAGAGAAQQPSNWATIPMPANVVSGPNSIGTTVTIMTTTAAWLYSGITKRWTTVPVTNPLPIFQANDYCIIQDGTKIHGYASHTDTVDTITTSGTPTIVSGPASSAWVTLIADGTTAWGFGAYHGKFEKITLTQPNPTMVANRLTGLLRDGSIVYAVSAHHGTFVPIGADTSAALTVVDESEVATASSPGVFRAFSTQQNTWAVQTVPTTASSVQQAEIALVWSGNQIWGFSGLSGVLDTYTASAPIPGVASSEGVGVFFDGNDVVCYGSGRGRFVKRPVAAGATLALDYHFAFVVEPAAVVPFSAVTGSFAAPLPGTFTIKSNDAIGWLDGGPLSYAYSPLLNAAFLAPFVNPTSVVLVRDSVTLVHATGYTSLSARYGTWVTQTTQQTNSFLAPSTGSTFVAIDGYTLHVFDARLNRWAATTGAGPMTLSIARHTAMAHDGQTAFGFGQPSGEWYAQPLTAAPSTFNVASSVGPVVHGTQISVYSVQGSFAFTGRYSGFTQTINLGNTLTLHQVAAPGSTAFLFAGLRPARIDLGPQLGKLYIDPNGLVSLGLSKAIGPSGLADYKLPLPNDPALVGGQVHLQDVVVPPSGPASAWLSSSVALILF